MSRAYRIRMTESGSRVIVAEDSVCLNIELLPILPPARLRELLAVELTARGFSVTGSSARRVRDGLELAVDLSEAVVTARLKRDDEVEGIASKTLKGTDALLTAAQRTQERSELRSRLEQKFAVDGRRLQRDVSAELQARLSSLVREVTEVSRRVVGAALKEKAAQLGEVVELIEHETGAMTIKVKL